MKVKFIKDHPAGIKKGFEKDVSDVDAKRWADQGYVEFVSGPKNASKKADAPKAEKKPAAKAKKK